MRVLGFMSGTSLDAVDMAVLETDGERIEAFGPAGERKLPEALRRLSLEATSAAQTWRRGEPEPEIFLRASTEIAEFQADAALSFVRENGMTPGDLDLAGFHAQTVLHERPTPKRVGRSVQIGDAALLARRLGVPVVYDLRGADVAAGGQGAPLAPAYHAALAAHAGLAPPLAVLNLGGVGNLTFVDGDGTLTAFDTGPANGPLDQWVERHGQGRYDEGGRLAAAGRADEDRIDAWLARPYFARFEPKSLDRYEFTSDLVADLSLQDGAATLAAFSAACVAHAMRQAPHAPGRLIVCGGGRRNHALMAELRRRAPAEVLTAEDAGWRGDSIEAEAWAFLAARSVKGLPITWPGTTGAPRPLTGGKLAEPPLLALQRHPQSHGGEGLRVGVDVRRPRADLLSLRYVVTGEVANLRLPPVSDPARRDELWRHTCFEAFARTPGSDRYHEFNFAPSTQWAAYRFDGYRAGMAAAEPIARPRIESRLDSQRLEVRVAVELDGLADLPSGVSWRLGVSAVLEDAAGRISYWALAHPPGKPDFHHRDGFSLDLPPTEP